jgi:hypothetical protein
MMVTKIALYKIDDTMESSSGKSSNISMTILMLRNIKIPSPTIKKIFLVG